MPTMEVFVASKMVVLLSRERIERLKDHACLWVRDGDGVDMLTNGFLSAAKVPPVPGAPTEKPQGYVCVFIHNHLGCSVKRVYPAVRKAGISCILVATCNMRQVGKDALHADVLSFWKGRGLQSDQVRAWCRSTYRFST
jgi:hypothetical protein